MKRLFGSAAAALTVLMSAPAHSEIFASEYAAKMKKYPEVVKTYLDGVGTGYSWANSQLKNAGQKRMYCPPTNLAVTRENYIQILEDEMRRSNPALNLPVEMLMLEGLARVFPCP